ncbi:hypothetical protein FED16_19165 [Acinetobacter baumannii]|uniref:hypothetical protein n=1 Tax=Acinetobacter baumannii TaxID=470 RepID=UPI0010FDD7BD|nr:hypothetical protein [Acinetobacter baumannii]TLL71459.1 hypothetical protein FEC89_19365 [Acinetobacter baumannii]TLM25046.1 hypothetical protein FEC38_18815 [Acinetobacter baumannii]TLM35151.1 hypothetical protein FEC37_18740 [Acinetobacter baumannii]TLN28081.1 hypothetical protein FED16_19165 [Acinetobacter baumannii]TLO84138.1 hypothetical protein FEG29_18470 [Acinetobacter baumannii]
MVGMVSYKMVGLMARFLDVACKLEKVVAIFLVVACKLELVEEFLDAAYRLEWLALVSALARA